MHYMQIRNTKSFLKTCKKLTNEQKIELKKVVDKLSNDPLLGKLKTANLFEVRVYKFSLVNHLTLLAYTYCEDILTMTFLKLGPHQNFYKDLENELKRSNS